MPAIAPFGHPALDRGDGDPPSGEHPLLTRGDVQDLTAAVRNLTATLVRAEQLLRDHMQAHTSPTSSGEST